MATHVLLIILLACQFVCGSENYRNDGLLNRLSNGMKFASDILGSESIASKVAEFVVRAFQTTGSQNTGQKRPPPANDAYIEGSSSEEISVEEQRPNYYINEIKSPMTPLRYLVKIFGLQPNQISAVAVNALVFVAQMISSFLAGPTRPTRPYRYEDPTSWILNKNSRHLQDLIARAKNDSILNDIDGMIKEHGTEETSCIRLLVCKITPFVHKMQDAVFGKTNETVDGDVKKLRGAATMYRHLPTAEEINENSDTCEQKHKDCDLRE